MGDADGIFSLLVGDSGLVGGEEGAASRGWSVAACFTTGGRDDCSTRGEGWCSDG